MTNLSEMAPPPLLLPSPMDGGLGDVWSPLESPTRVKARLDGLEMVETNVIGMPESPTRVKARLDGLDFPNKPSQFVLPVSIYRVLVPPILGPIRILFTSQ